MFFKISFLFLFFFYKSLLQATSWSDPSSLSEVSSAEHPRLATNSSGDVIAIWTDNDPARIISSSIQYYGSSIWHPTTHPSGDIYNPISPEIGLDDFGNAAACWFSYDNRVVPFVVGLHAAYLQNESLTWDTPQEIFSSDSIGTHTLAMSSNGDSIILFNSSSGGYRIYYSRRAYSDTSWSASQEIPGQTTSGSHMEIGMDNEGNAICTWSSSGKVLFSYYNNQTHTWSDPAIISDPSISAFDPELSVDKDGNAYVVWLFSNLGKLSVAACYLKAKTITWSNPISISNPQKDARGLKVNCKNNKAVVTWYTYDVPSLLQVAISETGKNQWSEPETVAESNFINQVNGLIDQVGNITVFMKYPNDPYYDLSSYSLPYGSERWTIGSYINERGTTVDEYYNLFNFQGKAYVAFIPQYNSTLLSTLASPPYNPIGFKKNNNFGLVSEFFNQLNWQPSQQSDIEGINFFKNDELLEEMNPEGNSFEEHNVPPNLPTIYKVNAYDSVSESPEFTIIR